jgi:hypothetical protein
MDDSDDEAADDDCPAAETESAEADPMGSDDSTAREWLVGSSTDAASPLST